jgi:hypothetical protein
MMLRLVVARPRSATPLLVWHPFCRDPSKRSFRTSMSTNAERASSGRGVVLNSVLNEHRPQQTATELPSNLRSTCKTVEHFVGIAQSEYEAAGARRRLSSRRFAARDAGLRTASSWACSIPPVRKQR